MLNIVIPMAGAGSRFLNAGYKEPKPLIKIHGRPMIEVVINNLRPKCDHKFIFICQKEHAEKYRLEHFLNTWAPGSKVIMIQGLTDGAACTVLKAKEFINSTNELMIANSDQYVDIDVNKYLSYGSSQNLDGLIMSMQASDPKWSYAKVGEDGIVTEVVEKEVVSNNATVGIYNFRSGKDFVDAAEEMISMNMRVNGEFYVAPVYNHLIEKGRRIGLYSIGSVGDGMYGLGIPEDLERFLTHKVSIRLDVA
jgi:dTDP-glucose pyrophosphorylase